MFKCLHSFLILHVYVCVWSNVDTVCIVTIIQTVRFSFNQNNSFNFFMLEILRLVPVFL